MIYMLDTNACIHYLNATSRALIARVLDAGPRALVVSSLTVAELHFGAARSSKPRLNLERVHAFLSELQSIPFSDTCAAAFGRVKADLLAKGKPVSDFDIAIGATALTMDCVVVSDDSDFRRIPGLVVENWIRKR